MAVSLTTEPAIRSSPGRAGRQALTPARLALDIIKTIVLLLLAASFLLPLYWMVSSAVKDDTQVYTVPPVWIPIPAHLNNFWDAWNTYNFNLYMVNTVVRYAIPTTVGTLLSSAIVAYGFSRVRWRGRDLVFSVCLATMMVPYAVTLIPLFITFKALGWVPSYLPLVVPSFFGSPYFIFMLRQFYLTIPQELSDAARVDGATELGILFRIILPLSKPALAVVALFQFMNAWNDYFGPLIYLNNQSLYPIALGIQNLQQNISVVSTVRLQYPYLMAVSTIATLPILIGFFFAQRTFIEGISLTGLKG
jgi:multiple sugar transport system permease protein